MLCLCRASTYCDACRTWPQASPSGGSQGAATYAGRIRRLFGIGQVLLSTAGPFICSPAAADYSSGCGPGSRPVCDSSCSPISCCYFRLVSLGRFVCLFVRVFPLLLIVRTPAGSHPAVHPGPGLWGFLVPVPSGRHPFGTQPRPRNPSASRSQSHHPSSTRAPSATRSWSQAQSATRSSWRALSSTQSRSQALSPTRSSSRAPSPPSLGRRAHCLTARRLLWGLASQHVSSERLQASSTRSSSIRVDSRSHSRARLPAHSRPSSSSVVIASCESCSPLNMVPGSYSTGTSSHSRSPSVASSRTHSHSRLPGLEGCHSRLRSRLRARRSPSAVSSSGMWGGGGAQRVLSAVATVLVSFKDVFQGWVCFAWWKRHSCSRSSSLSQWVDEDHQEEQSSLDFVSIMVTLQSLNDLPGSFREPQDSRIQATLEDDEQPALSYRMPVGCASADILADIDYWVSSPSSGMRSKKVSKLLQYPGISSRRFCRFQGEEVTKVKALNSHVMELAGLRSWATSTRQTLFGPLPRPRIWRRPWNPLDELVDSCDEVLTAEVHQRRPSCSPPQSSWRQVPVASCQDGFNPVGQRHSQKTCWQRSRTQSCLSPSWTFEMRSCPRALTYSRPTCWRRPWKSLQRSFMTMI